MRPPIYLPESDLSDIRISPSIVILGLFLAAIGLIVWPVLLLIGIGAEIAMAINPKLKKEISSDAIKAKTDQELKRIRAR